MEGVLLTCLLVCATWTRFTDAVVPDGCDGRMDLVFVMDHSESIRDNDPPNKAHFNWHHYTNFTKRIIQNLPVAMGDTRVGLVKYGTKAKLEFNLDSHLNSWDVQNAVARMTYDGGLTNTYDALRLATHEVFFPHPGDRPGYRNVMVLMTDGMANVEQTYTLSMADAAKAANIEIFTIGISNEVDAGELGDIASDNRHYIHVNKFDNLEDYIRLVTHRVCGLPDPVPPSDRPDGCKKHCEVCSHHHNICARCQSGWYWNTANARCQACEMRMDLCFLIDASGSITDKNPEDKSYDNFVLLKEFVKDMIGLLDVAPDRTQIGALKFSDFSTKLFNLDTFTTQEDMKHAIDIMTHDGGNTNTSGALRLMRQSLFRRERGDRPDARNVAIVITDGESTFDKNLTIPEADMAKEAGVAIFVLGITNDINEAEAKAVASDPDSEYYINSTSIRSLQKVKDKLIKHVCTPESPIRKARSVDSNSHVLSKRDLGDWITGKRSSAPAVWSSWGVLCLVIFSIYHNFHNQIHVGSHT